MSVKYPFLWQNKKVENRVGVFLFYLFERENISFYCYLSFVILIVWEFICSIFKSPWCCTTNKCRNPTCFLFFFLLRMMTRPHHHKRKHTHTPCLQTNFFQKEKEEEEKKTWISIFFSLYFMSLYYAVGQKLICPIGKFLLQTMQINIFSELLDWHSCIYYYTSVDSCSIFLCRSIRKIKNHK